MKHILTAALVLVLAMSVVGFAQETKNEMKKDKGMKMMEIACKPECGFMVRSHDENEVMSMGKIHAKQQHNMDLTDDQAKGMVHEAKPMMKRSMMKDEMKKDEMKKDEMKKD